ncbi:hypothetical protein GCM10025867_32470 [Frondihabitans sucicola]|uniref:DUF4129 domain-containing protein n=1 Tax=Frondihabitans sucicola TaxID=1268041 RepID=A0ABN6Y1T8_9MICO|nr:hypothetical protein [Frondihabitans sucicola]BDZ51006.1 hypothetical protein GCM10025867_32470 [Frondihabitans sucicola]
MLSDRGFFGPAQYERFVLYLVVGVLLLALVAACYVFVIRYSRTRSPRPAVAGAARVDLGTLRGKYAAMIDEVEAAWVAGDLSERAVHSRLSLLLRFFAFEASGVDAQVMTLSDLRSSALPSVTGAVEQFYPPAFQLEHPGDPAAAVRTAREVVSSWS